MPRAKGVKQVAANRKALHDYFVLERFEAGVELFGTEVKSIRAGTVNLKDSFCTVKNGELFAYGIHISPYEHGSIYNRDPDRPKRLLMHRREITKLYAHEAGRADARAAVAVFQGQPREGGARPVQGQKALRQARRRRPAGRQAFH